MDEVEAGDGCIGEDTEAERTGSGTKWNRRAERRSREAGRQAKKMRAPRILMFHGACPML